MFEHLVRRFFVDNRASVSTIFGLSAIPLVIVMGVAIEYSRASEAKVRLQAGVDAGVLAGVRAPTAQRSAVATATLQGALAGASPFFGAVSSSWTTNTDGTFTGNASAAYSTTFLEIANIKTLNLHAAASAAGATNANAVCVLVLDPSSSQTLLVNSGVTISAPTCEIDVASTGSPAAIFNSGDTFNLHRICVAGTNTTQNGGSVPGLTTNCTVPANPYASSLPAVSVGSCTVSNQNYSGTNTLNPGVYCGNFNFNGSGTLSLQPGLYAFKGANWNLNSSWTVSGTGVTFYFADSNSYIQVNSGVSVNLSAPTSGTYANILMFEPNGLSTSSYTINGSAGHVLNGLMYQPSRNITFNSQSNTSSEGLTIVVNRLILDTLSWSLAPATGFSISPSGASSSAANERLIR